MANAPGSVTKLLDAYLSQHMEPGAPAFARSAGLTPPGSYAQGLALTQLRAQPDQSSRPQTFGTAPSKFFDPQLLRTPAFPSPQTMQARLSGYRLGSLFDTRRDASMPAGSATHAALDRTSTALDNDTKLQVLRAELQRQALLPGNQQGAGPASSMMSPPRPIQESALQALIIGRRSIPGSPAGAGGGRSPQLDSPVYARLAGLADEWTVLRDKYAKWDGNGSPMRTAASNGRGAVPPASGGSTLHPTGVTAQYKEVALFPASSQQPAQPNPVGGSGPSAVLDGSTQQASLWQQPPLTAASPSGHPPRSRLGQQNDTLASQAFTRHFDPSSSPYASPAKVQASPARNPYQQQQPPSPFTSLLRALAQPEHPQRSSRSTMATIAAAAPPPLQAGEASGLPGPGRSGPPFAATSSTSIANGASLAPSLPLSLSLSPSRATATWQGAQAGVATVLRQASSTAPAAAPVPLPPHESEYYALLRKLDSLRSGAPAAGGDTLSARDSSHAAAGDKAPQGQNADKPSASRPLFYASAASNQAAAAGSSGMPGSVPAASASPPQLPPGYAEFALLRRKYASGGTEEDD